MKNRDYSLAQNQEPKSHWIWPNSTIHPPKKLSFKIHGEGHAKNQHFIIMVVNNRARVKQIASSLVLISKTQSP